MTRSIAEKQARLAALDGLRGLAAAGILVLHVWMFDHGDSHVPAMTALDRSFEALRLGVPLFFALSGFLLYRPFVGAVLDGRGAPRLGAYAIRRAARILPGYWAAVAGTFVLLAALDHPQQATLGQLPIFALFAQNQFDATAKQLDPPMWTLAVEVSFYALLPLAGLAALKLGAHRGRQLALCAALLLTGIALTGACVAFGWPWTATASLLTHLPEFAAGMAAAALLHGRRPAPRVAAAMIAGGAALVVLNALWFALKWEPTLARAVLRDAPAAMGFALIVGALSSADIRAAALTCAPVRALGAISFGLYLWHYPAIMWLRAQGHWPEQIGPALGATMALTIPAAALSWFAIEQPAIALGRRLSSRPAGTASAAAAPRTDRPRSAGFRRPAFAATEPRR